MTTCLLLAAVVLAGDPTIGDRGTPTQAPQSKDSDETVTARELRAVVSEALRREATATDAAHADAVRHLADVYNALKADTQLPDGERRQRLGQVRHRLARVADQLARDATVAGARQPRGNLVLAQRVGAAAGGARGGPLRPAAAPAAGQSPAAAVEADAARRLIELIQDTIAPDSWDVRGGGGTIFYFPPKKVLVIRQTGAVHRQFRDLVGQLRRN